MSPRKCVFITIEKFDFLKIQNELKLELDIRTGNISALATGNGLFSLKQLNFDCLYRRWHFRTNNHLSTSSVFQIDAEKLYTAV